MKKNLLLMFLIAVFCLFLNGCFVFSKSIQLSGDVQTKEYQEINSKKFSNLKVKNIRLENGLVDLSIKESDTPYVKITSQESLFYYLSVEVINNTLILKSEHSNIYTTNDDVVIEIGTTCIKDIEISGCNSDIDGSIFDDYSEIDLSGAGSYNFTDITGQKVEIEVSGMVELNFSNIKLNKLLLELSGNTNIKANKIVCDDEVQLEASGNSKISIFALEAKELEAEFSGSARFIIEELNIAENIEIESSGKCDFLFSGVAESLNCDLSGECKLSFYGLTLKKADIEASGSSKIEIVVEDKINVSLSGKSILKYKGRPAFGKVETSGSSSIENIQ